MKIVKKSFKVFDFDELNEEAQEKVLYEFADINVDNDWWYVENDELLDSCLPDYIQKDLKLKMLETGKQNNRMFSWSNIYFSLDRYRYLQFKDLEVHFDNEFFKFMKFPKRFWKDLFYSFEYGRESSITVRWSTTKKYYYDKKWDFYADRATGIFDDLIERALKKLEDDYEYLTSREAVIETIKANDFKFLEDGTVFN